MMRRREFIGGLASAGCCGLVGGCAVFRSGLSYSVSVLGDTHYDAAPDSTYHAFFRMAFDGTRKHPNRYKEFARNAKLWAGPSRRILEASGRCVTPDTRFALQLGDLVQGDCNNFAVHKRMLGDALAVMRNAYPKNLPFVTVCGNHDIRHGNDKDDNAAIKPYGEHMIPYLRGQVGSMACGDVEDTTFGFRYGPDLYVAINFNKGAATVPAVKRILAENPDVRYTFVALHGGVFPFDSWERRWFYLGHRAEDVLRREMRALLASRSAIVLSGHTHFLELKDATFPEGRLTEMTMNTMPPADAADEPPSDPKEPVEPPALREGAASYGDTDWVRGNPEIQSLFAEYQPHMTRYFLSKAAGHARMRVSDGGVWFDFYDRDGIVPAKTFRLR